MLDFRNYKALVAEEIEKLNQKDERDWGWGAKANKNSIKISWGYFKYGGNPEDRFTIKYECGDEFSEDLIIYATDPFWGNIGGRIVGDKFYCDGSIEDCIRSLFNSVFAASQNW